MRRSEGVRRPRPAQGVERHNAPAALSGSLSSMACAGRCTSLCSEAIWLSCRGGDWIDSSRGHPAGLSRRSECTDPCPWTTPENAHVGLRSSSLSTRHERPPKPPVQPQMAEWPVRAGRGRAGVADDAQSYRPPAQHSSRRSRALFAVLELFNTSGRAPRHAATLRFRLLPARYRSRWRRSETAACQRSNHPRKKTRSSQPLSRHTLASA